MRSHGQGSRLAHTSAAGTLAWLWFSRRGSAAHASTIPNLHGRLCVSPPVISGHSEIMSLGCGIADGTLTDRLPLVRRAERWAKSYQWDRVATCPITTQLPSRSFGGSASRQLRRKRRVLLYAAHEVKCRVQRPVVLCIRWDVRLRARFLLPIGFEVPA